MVTPQEFKTMQNSARCLLEVVFEYEKQFKEDFITNSCCYQDDEYQIERAHVSGFALRVTLLFNDYSRVDIYRDLEEVIQWYYDLAEKVLKEK